MKKLILTMLLAAILAFALQVQPARAADSSNVAVRVVETNTTITFYMNFTFLGTGTDSRFSRAINISELDMSLAQFAFKGNGAGSIDIDIHLHTGSQLEAVTTADSTGASNSLELADTIEDTALANRQALGSSTPTLDGIVSTEEVISGQWLVLEADGQAGNPTTAELSVSLTTIKRTGAPSKQFRQYQLILDTK